MRNNFKNFITNSSNLKAYTLAVEVAEGIEIADPLFLYGPSGTGKSHLLDGIWHHYLERNDKHPEWISSLGFNDFLKASNYEVNEMIKRYEEISLLLIDDIDLIEDNQNGILLAKIFDSLVKQGKQLCLTSSKRLNELGPELYNFLSKGKCIELSFPNFDEQRDFYTQMLSKEGILIHDKEVLDYLCSSNKDYRTMKAEIIRLKYNMVLENCETANLGFGAVKRYLEN